MMMKRLSKIRQKSKNIGDGQNFEAAKIISSAKRPRNGELFFYGRSKNSGVVNSQCWVVDIEWSMIRTYYICKRQLMASAVFIFLHLNWSAVVTLDEILPNMWWVHCVAQKGEQLHFTNGEGYLLTAEVADDHRKNVVNIVEERFVAHNTRKVIRCYLSLMKTPVYWNGSWKATEIGGGEMNALCKRIRAGPAFWSDRCNIML